MRESGYVMALMLLSGLLATAAGIYALRVGYVAGKSTWESPRGAAQFGVANVVFGTTLVALAIRDYRRRR